MQLQSKYLNIDLETVSSKNKLTLQKNSVKDKTRFMNLMKWKVIKQLIKKQHLKSIVNQI